MLNIDELKFDDKGLIPAVVVDAVTKQVLTLAYMNRESLRISMEKGLTCFWSRSRQELWLKGETSGNYQHIVSITADCDRDALLVKVEKDGPACHTGTESCFNDEVWESDERQLPAHRFHHRGLRPGCFGCESGEGRTGLPQGNRELLQRSPLGKR